MEHLKLLVRSGSLCVLTVKDFQSPAIFFVQFVYLCLLSYIHTHHIFPPSTFGKSFEEMFS